jgi:transcriptional regulator with PAS, ATPase and Fis domain
MKNVIQAPDIPYQILDLLSDALAVLDPKGSIVYSNNAFKSLDGNLFGPEDSPVSRWFSSQMAKMPDSRDGLAPVQLTSGRKTFHAFVRPLDGPGHKSRFYVLIVKPSKEGMERFQSRNTRYPAGQGALSRSEALSPEFRELKGEEPVFREALLTAQKAARTDFPVLILGESGTGKEILARMIHKASRRSKKNFVDINCAAIPETLIESELFGYEKGGFTGAGAKGRRGLFEEAHEGSIFLDEIGDASLQIQAKILRALQEGCFKRVGGNRNIEVNVRHISATNRDLSSLIVEGKFREDLFYRLNTITIEMPPLRKRPNDIALLIEYFVQEYSRREGKQIFFSSDCLEFMESYAWPGNIRELKGVVDYAITMATDSLISPDCLPSFLLPPQNSNLSNRPNPVPVVPTMANDEMNHTLPVVVQQLEKELIMKALEKSGSKTEAIKALGISRRTFYIKIKQYGLE